MEIEGSQKEAVLERREREGGGITTGFHQNYIRRKLLNHLVPHAHTWLVSRSQTLTSEGSYLII